MRRVFLCKDSMRDYRLYFQQAVGKRDGYQLVHGDLLRQHPFGITLRSTGPVPMDSRQ